MGAGPPYCLLDARGLVTDIGVLLVTSTLMDIHAWNGIIVYWLIKWKTTYNFPDISRMFFVLNPNPTIRFKAGAYTGPIRLSPPPPPEKKKKKFPGVSQFKLESKKMLNPPTPDKILYTPLTGGFSCPFNISAWIRLSSWYCKPVWTVGGLCPYLYLNKYKFYPNLSDWWLENFLIVCLSEFIDHASLKTYMFCTRG